jgi:hypothetical protein
MCVQDLTDWFVCDRDLVFPERYESTFKTLQSSVTLYKSLIHIQLEGVRSGAGGWGTALQAGR